MQVVGPQNAFFNYIFEINFQKFMWKDWFMNMEKHGMKMIKSVFICKTICGTDH